jgi:hypothetical protein
VIKNRVEKKTKKKGHDTSCDDIGQKFRSFVQKFIDCVIKNRVEKKTKKKGHDTSCDDIVQKFVVQKFIDRVIPCWLVNH